MELSGRLRQLGVLSAVLAGLISGCGGGGGALEDSAQCANFTYQEDAQAAFRAGATQLDADNDGIACESLPSRPAPTPAIVQGFYTGSLTGSTSSQFQLLALENGDVWSLYGNPSGSTFAVRGFVQGPTTRSGSAVSSNAIKDFGFNPAPTGVLTATATTAAVSGTLAFNGSSFSFSGTPPAASAYDYNRAANLAEIAGAWTLTGLDGTITSVNIASNGSFTGSSGACTISGTMSVRPSGKNVFNVSVAYGGAPCATPGTVATGIAVTYLLTNSTTRELVVAGVNSARTAGNAYFGFR
jgi:hypothetical protein